MLPEQRPAVASKSWAARTAGCGRSTVTSSMASAAAPAEKERPRPLENQTCGAPLAFNLHDPDSTTCSCAGASSLPAAFSARNARTRELDGLPIETIPTLFDSPTVIETDSLPKPDLVRFDALALSAPARAASANNDLAQILKTPNRRLTRQIKPVN